MKKPPLTNVGHRMGLGPSSPGQLVPAPPLTGTYALQSSSGTTSWATPGGGGGGFSDNASALRTRQDSWLRRNERLNGTNGFGLTQTINFNGSNPPFLRDEIGKPACLAMATISDRVFFVGSVGPFGGQVGQMWAIDLFTQAGVNPAFLSPTPLHTFGDTPAEMLAVRGTSLHYIFYEPEDYLFMIFPATSKVELGVIGGVFPTVSYTTVTNLSTASPPIRACHIGGGGGDTGFEGSGTNIFPCFAFGAQNGHIYIFDGSGTIHDAFTTGDLPGAMFFDDSGFLWVVYETAQQIVKFSVNYTTMTLASVQTISTGVAVLDLISDGRSARGLVNNAGTPNILAWDLQSGTAGRTLTINTSFGSQSWGTPVDEFYNSSTDLVWIADQNPQTATSGAIVVMKASDQTTHAILPIPATPTTGDLPSTWNGCRRVIGDATYVYASDARANDPNVAIINQSTFQVVGLCQVSAGQARDQCVDGAGNLYVVARNNSTPANSTIQKFNIAAAIAAYPTPVGPTATSPNRAYHVCCWDPVTSSVFGGEFAFGGGNQNLVKLTTGLAETSFLSFTPSGSFTYFYGLLAAFGSVWCGTDSTSVLRVNPSTFPAGGSVTTIATSLTFTAQLNADTTFNTVLVQDATNSGTTSRISSGSSTEVSTFSFSPYGFPLAVFTPTAIWVAQQSSSPATDIALVSTGVGTETLLSRISGYAASGFFGRLGWDGVSIYLSIIAPTT